MVRFDFELEARRLDRNMLVLDDRLDRAVAGVVKQRSHIAEAYMKTTARWTDRTGNARATLRTTTEHFPKKQHIIHLFGMMPYQIWLEVRHGGRYAIIIPTIPLQAKLMMRTFNKLFARL